MRSSLLYIAPDRPNRARCPFAAIRTLSRKFYRPCARFQGNPLISDLGEHPYVLGESWTRLRQTLTCIRPVSYTHLDVYKRQNHCYIGKLTVSTENDGWS